MERHTFFKHRNEDLPAVYVRTDIISPGVTCEVYLDPTTGKRDYGKVTVEPGYKTPKQKVLSGDETIELLLFWQRPINYYSHRWYHINF